MCPVKFFPNGERNDTEFFFNFAVVGNFVRQAVPRFYADIGCAYFLPDAEVGRVLVIHFNGNSGFF